MPQPAPRPHVNTHPANMSQQRGPCHQEERAAFIFSNSEVAAISQHLGDEDRAGKWVLFSKSDTKQHHKSILRSRDPGCQALKAFPNLPAATPRVPPQGS